MAAELGRKRKSNEDQGAAGKKPRLGGGEGGPKGGKGPGGKGAGGKGKGRGKGYGNSHKLALILRVSKNKPYGRIITFRN